MKIVSFSLWGDSPIYLHGFVENMKLVEKYYPGWDIFLYTTKDCLQKLTPEIEASNVLVITTMKEDPLSVWDASFWRYEAVLDGDISTCHPPAEAIIFRDADSRISEREQKAVHQWLDSDKQFHIMRDHPYHTVPIMAGMWGLKLPLTKEALRNKFVKIAKDSSDWHIDKKGADQEFLQYDVYNLIVNDSLIHVNNCNYREDFAVDFPTKRLEDKSFVGEAFEADNTPHQWDRDLL